MSTVTSRVGGRPALIAVDDVVRVGRELGLRRLSVNAVAARLGVSATALYRHVESRWELERLVGESLLAELELRDDPDDGIEGHLLSFGLQPRALHRRASRSGVLSAGAVPTRRRRGAVAGHRGRCAESARLRRRGGDRVEQRRRHPGDQPGRPRRKQHQHYRWRPGRQVRGGTRRRGAAAGRAPAAGRRTRCAPGVGECGVRAAVAGRVDQGAGRGDPARASDHRSRGGHTAAGEDR